MGEATRGAQLRYGCARDHRGRGPVPRLAARPRHRPALRSDAVQADGAWDRGHGGIPNPAGHDERGRGDRTRVAGLRPGTVVLGGAATAVVFGLTAQQTLANVIAGAVLLNARTFRVGERVRLQGGSLAGSIEGIVNSLGLMYTTLAQGADDRHPDSRLAADHPGGGRCERGRLAHRRDPARSTGRPAARRRGAPSDRSAGGEWRFALRLTRTSRTTHQMSTPRRRNVLYATVK